MEWLDTGDHSSLHADSQDHQKIGAQKNGRTAPAVFLKVEDVYFLGWIGVEAGEAEAPAVAACCC
jgi:hypothetical protein